MNIREKLELAEELYSKGDDWNAEDIQGSAYLDVRSILNHIDINNDKSFFDIVDDLTFDEFTLIIQLKNKGVIDIMFDKLFELDEKLGGDMELSYLNGHVFLYKDF